MNIFYLSKSPQKCAEYHCDKHVVKMIVETAQLLSTAVHSVGIHDPVLYRQTHKNHPSAVWVRQNKAHYIWTIELLNWLCYEYTRRYGKVHKTAAKILPLSEYGKYFPVQKWRDPPQCMPDDCKGPNTIQAYKKYYKLHKASFATWKTKVPSWFIKES